MNEVTDLKSHPEVQGTPAFFEAPLVQHAVVALFMSHCLTVTDCMTDSQRGRPTLHTQTQVDRMEWNPISKQRENWRKWRLCLLS